MIEKLARKPSADPVQEKLRQDKALWNKGVSVFITNLINFKKTMNGSPSKYFKERSKIVQPIPANPVAIIDSLAGNFQELAQQGSALVQEQLAYSKNRRPKQPKAAELPKAETTAPPTPAAPAPDLSKQLAAWEQKYNLVAEGSNPFSRFLVQRITRERGLDDRARDNRIRMDMLKSCVKAYKALGKLQVQVVGSGKDNVSNAYKMMQAAYHNWSIVARGFSTFKSMMNASQQQSTTTETTDLPDENREGQEPPLEDAAPVPPPPPPPNVGSPLPEASPVPPTPMAPPASPKEIIDRLVKKQNETKAIAANQSAVQLEVVAQAFIKKWLGKKRHQLAPQRDSSYRLEIFKLAAQARKDINKIMDSLEKSLDYNTLNDLISQVNRQMTSLRMLMRSLHLSEKPDAAGALPL